MRLFTVLAVLTALFLLGACGEKQPGSTATSPPPVVEVKQEATRPAPTPEEWRAAVEGTYAMNRVTDSGDGVTEFTACFEEGSPGERCKHIAFATRDGFRKLRIYMPGVQSAHPVLNALAVYVSLPDNEAPRVLLAPVAFGKSGPLFLEHVAVMVDGEVVLEQKIVRSSVRREIFPGGVQERADFIASEDQIQGLRRIRADSKVLVRFTGEKGYMSLPKDDVKHFQEETQNLIFVYDKLSQAVAGKTRPSSAN